MTQEQCLDNGHRAESNNNSPNDQVSDDTNVFKNSTIGSEVNGMQELNVNVNSKRSEHSANVVTVRNFGVDNASRASGKVLARESDRSAVTKIDLVNLSEISVSQIDSSNVNNKSSVECSAAPNMTVITHQSSSENIREIVEDSNKINKRPSESELTLAEKNVIKEVTTKKSDRLKRSKAEYKSISEDDKPEDPIERLNKLRASISNALSEVKGVLKQYSTEQNEEEKESSQSLQPAVDGPVRFRFVRKIRRRSVFSEEDENVLPAGNENTEDIKLSPATEEKNASTISANKFEQNKEKDVNVTTSEASQNVNTVVEGESFAKQNDGTVHIRTADTGIGRERENVSRKQPMETENQKAVAKDNAAPKNIGDVGSSPDVKKDLKENENEITPNNQLKKYNNEIQKENINQESGSDVITNDKGLRPNTDIKVLENVKNAVNNNDIAKNISDARPSLNTTSTQAKLRTLKTKKIVKKERRASIAAIEANPALTEELPLAVEVKAQRRPSDSATLVQASAKILLKSITKTDITSTQCSDPTASNTLSKSTDINKTSERAIISKPSVVNVIEKSVKASLPSLTEQKEDQQTNPTAKKTLINSQATLVSPMKTEKPIDSSDSPKLAGQDKCSVTNDSSLEKITVVIKITNEDINDEQLLNESEKNAPLEVLNEKVERIDEVLKDRVTDAAEAAENQIINEIPENAEQTVPKAEEAPQKKKRKAKRKVVIRRIKRKLSKDDTFIQTQDTPSELEICEKEIEEKDVDEEPAEPAELVPQQPRSCLKAREFQIGDTVMYAERFKKTQVKWRKAKVIERITSISYKLDIAGEEKPAHISYIKKFTDRKVNFGGKEYLEIDYAQIEEDEEKERNYSIWNLV